MSESLVGPQFVAGLVVGVAVSALAFITLSRSTVSQPKRQEEEFNVVSELLDVSERAEATKNVEEEPGIEQRIAANIEDADALPRCSSWTESSSWARSATPVSEPRSLRDFFERALPTAVRPLLVLNRDGGFEGDVPETCIGCAKFILSVSPIHHPEHTRE